MTQAAKACSIKKNARGAIAQNMVNRKNARRKKHDQGRKNKNGFKVEARGDSGEEFIVELLEATSSILANLLCDDMSESETDEFFEKYMDLLKSETKIKKEKIKRNDPSLRMIAKKRLKMPWE